MLFQGGVRDASDEARAEYPEVYIVHRYPYREVPPILRAMQTRRQNCAVGKASRRSRWGHKEGPYLERITLRSFGVLAKLIDDLRVREGLRLHGAYGSRLV